MRNLLISTLGITLGLLPMSAHATSVQAGADLDDFDNLTDGLDKNIPAKTTVRNVDISTSLKGWDISMTLSYARVGAEAASLRDSLRSLVGGDHRYKNGPVMANLSNVKIAAERSVLLAHGISLDLLARATLPTAKASAEFGTGRSELMLDAGLSKRIGPATVWAGGARRFRSQGYESTGRDIFEIYAGARSALGNRTTIRIDYLRAQPEYRGERSDQSTSLGISRTLKSGATLDISADHYRSAYYNGVQGNISLRWRI